MDEQFTDDIPMFADQARRMEDAVGNLLIRNQVLFDYIHDAMTHNPLHTFLGLAMILAIVTMFAFNIL